MPGVGSNSGAAWVPRVMTGETGNKTTEAATAAGGAPPVAQSQPGSNVGDTFTQSIPPKRNHVIYGPNGSLTMVGAEGRSYQPARGAGAPAAPTANAGGNQAPGTAQVQVETGAKTVVNAQTQP